MILSLSVEIFLSIACKSFLDRCWFSWFSPSCALQLFCFDFCLGLPKFRGHSLYRCKIRQCLNPSRTLIPWSMYNRTSRTQQRFTAYDDPLLVNIAHSPVDWKTYNSHPPGMWSLSKVIIRCLHLASLERCLRTVSFKEWMTKER